MKNLYLGIDFGTTSTCISYYDSIFKILVNEDGYYTTPTAVFFDKNSSNILFGLSAIQKSKIQGTIINNWKRIIGKSFTDLKDCDFSFFKSKGLNIIDIQNVPHFEIFYNNKTIYYNTLDLSILYLKYVYTLIIETVGKHNLNIVITIPAVFSSNARSELITAFERSNFNILKVLNEPTAAALAYDKIKNSEEILIFDCGGGTTDLSLIKTDYDNNIFEVIDIFGDNFLGGEDLTNNLTNYIINKFNIQISEKNYKKLHTEAENCKIYLSKFKANKEYTFFVECITDNEENVFDIRTKISQNLFLEINKLFFNTIKNLVSFFKQYDIQKTLFIGGSSKFYYFINLFRQVFPNIIILDNIDPDHAVALGACKHATTLTQDDDDDTDDILLLDIVPISLGVEIEGGLFDVIIPRCSVLPEHRTKVFTNDSDIDSIEINIFQGESRFVKNNYHLNTIIIPLDKSYKKAESKIFIEFSIDTSGVFDISVKIDNNVIKTQLTKQYIENRLPPNLDEIIYKYTVDKLYENNLANKILEELSNS